MQGDITDDCVAGSCFVKQQRPHAVTCVLVCVKCDRNGEVGHPHSKVDFITPVEILFGFWVLQVLGWSGTSSNPFLRACEEQLCSSPVILRGMVDVN